MEAESAVECRVILDRRGDGLEHDLVMLESLPATLLFVARFTTTVHVQYSACCGDHIGRNLVESISRA